MSIWSTNAEALRARLRSSPIVRSGYNIFRLPTLSALFVAVTARLTVGQCKLQTTPPDHAELPCQAFQIRWKSTAVASMHGFLPTTTISYFSTAGNKANTTSSISLRLSCCR